MGLEKRIAEVFAVHVWPEHVRAALRRIHIVNAEPDAGITGSIAYDADGYTILAAGGRPALDLVRTLYHETGHAKRGRMERGKGTPGLGADDMLAVMHGDWDAVDRHAAARTPDPAEERWCDAWAEVKTLLCGEALVRAARGEPGAVDELRRLDGGAAAIWWAAAEAERGTKRIIDQVIRQARAACKGMGARPSVKAINEKHGVTIDGGPGERHLVWGKGWADLDMADLDALQARGVPPFIISALKRRRRYIAYVTELLATGALAPAA